jgi:hypothetical protein
MLVWEQTGHAWPWVAYAYQAARLVIILCATDNGGYGREWLTNGGARTHPTGRQWAGEGGGESLRRRGNLGKLVACPPLVSVSCRYFGERKRGRHRGIDNEEGVDEMKTFQKLDEYHPLAEELIAAAHGRSRVRWQFPVGGPRQYPEDGRRASCRRGMTAARVGYDSGAWWGGSGGSAWWGRGGGGAW